MASRSITASPQIHSVTARGDGWFGWLRQAMDTVESRRHLAAMDDRMLADIGISRSEAIEEASRAPWDVAPRRR